MNNSTAVEKVFNDAELDFLLKLNSLEESTTYPCHVKLNESPPQSLYPDPLKTVEKAAVAAKSKFDETFHGKSYKLTTFSSFGSIGENTIYMPSAEELRGVHLGLEESETQLLENTKIRPSTRGHKNDKSGELPKKTPSRSGLSRISNAPRLSSKNQKRSNALSSINE
ncbi:MAG: hypothetical protein CK425_01770 [Parachlamydia sp.]|nr:MAG: hypothetical protein CK425_01770 [Parachlamydia sp.]